MYAGPVGTVVLKKKRTGEPIHPDQPAGRLFLKRLLRK